MDIHRSKEEVAINDTQSVIAALETLHDKSDKMSKLILEIEGRLKMVVGDQIQNPPHGTRGVGKIEEAVCPLAHSMRSVAYKMENQILQLESLLSRLQL